jgi:formylglycine-generating enzyme required for sulfatase activity
MLSAARRLLLSALLLVLGATLALQPEPGQTAPAPRTMNRFTNSIKMKLVRIRAGKFLMGSPADEPGRRPSEHRHEVEITRPFFLAVYAVTQAQYQKVMGNNPSYFSPTGGGRARAGGDSGDLPVETVSWNDAVAFCKKLSALPAEKGARRVYRLPTEAEWEYACRAGTSTAYYVGKTLEARHANFAPSPVNRVSKVGSYKPNAWGLYDMHGNVWQWCADWFGEDYYRTSPKKDPAGPKAGTSRVVRGGCWLNAGQECRAAIRPAVPPTYTSNHVGFRVACDVGGRR